MQAQAFHRNMFGTPNVEAFIEARETSEYKGDNRLAVYSAPYPTDSGAVIHSAHSPTAARRYA